MPIHRFQRVYVEITTICNLRCTFCPTTSRPLERMHPDFFAHVLTQVRPVTDQISLHVLGEPLTHPQLPTLLALCAEAGLLVNITTNGTLLAPWTDLLLQPVVRQINFSLQALEKADGPDLAALDQIMTFAHHARRLRPDLYINYRLWNLASLHAAPMSAFHVTVLERIARTLRIPRPELPAGRKSRRLADRHYLHLDSQFHWPDTIPVHEQAKGFCHALSTHCAILVDGTVCPCCLDANGAIALGNLHTASLSEILSHPRSAAMRAGFSHGQLVEAVCQRCSYCLRFPVKTTRTPATHPAMDKG